MRLDAAHSEGRADTPFGPVNIEQLRDIFLRSGSASYDQNMADNALRKLCLFAYQEPALLQRSATGFARLSHTKPSHAVRPTCQQNFDTFCIKRPVVLDPTSCSKRRPHPTPPSESPPINKQSFYRSHHAARTARGFNGNLCRMLMLPQPFGQPPSSKPQETEHEYNQDSGSQMATPISGFLTHTDICINQCIPDC